MVPPTRSVPSGGGNRYPPRLPQWSQNENKLFHLGTSLPIRLTLTQAKRDLKSADYADFSKGVLMEIPRRDKPSNTEACNIEETEASTWLITPNPTKSPQPFVTFVSFCGKSLPGNHGSFCLRQLSRSCSGICLFAFGCYQTNLSYRR